MAGKKRLSRSSRQGRAVIIGIILILLITLLVRTCALIRQNAAYTAQKEELEQQLADEQVRAAAIQKLKEYVQTTEYAEQAAREKLGLVYPDDILFEPEETN